IAEIESDQLQKRQALETILANHLEENQGNYPEARFQAIDECTFTLFNRIAAIKVMESRELFPEIIKQRVENGNRSFAHTAWLEEHPEERSAEREGLKSFLRDEFDRLGDELYLFNQDYPYALLPTADELYRIIDAFNQVEEDADCGVDTWRNDDILGWLYESYNAIEKEQLKASGVKTEFDKVSLQSQVYTPKWVVKFLVDNSLGKLYLEMFPDSALRENYKIANVPTHSVRHSQPLEELKLIDPACGSGNFLLYAFDLFYDMYVDQMEHYNADYSQREIPRLIIERNLHGIDLDERAVQIAQLGLYIKARTHRGRSVRKYNVIASHFILPEYEEVKEYFEAGEHYDDRKKTIMCDIWNDLRAAYKFGSLVRVEEKLEAMMPHEEISLFSVSEMQDVFSFRQSFVTKLRNHLQEYSNGLFGNSFMRFRTSAAMDFLDIISKKYDVAVANPPYTDSADFGMELKAFVDENYKKPLKFNTNLYASFIKRCCELTDVDGKVGMVHPLSFMYIKTFEDVRKFIVEKTHINILAELGLGGVFINAQVDVAAYVLDKDTKKIEDGIYINLTKYKNHTNKPTIFGTVYDDLVENRRNSHIYVLSQSKLKSIKSYPFIYWISDEFREKFNTQLLGDILETKKGMDTSCNERFLRFWWEIAFEEISENYYHDKKKWVRYAKGGPFNKWYGNFWLTVNWENSGYDIKHYTDENGKIKSNIRNEVNYFSEGITYSAAGSKGTTFRYMPQNMIFDSGGPGIFMKKYKNINFILALLNSQLIHYVCDCLNPTVNTTHGDLRRIPFVVADTENETIIDTLSSQCVSIKCYLCTYSIIEHNSIASPITSANDVRIDIYHYFCHENALLSQLLINEALINNAIFEIYALNAHDKQMVL
ncbi:MAG TPA: BREX-1 system adenine-specific DNA-methyltransferase PglX, partial [Bacteroides reticulotermitis]|nr:BREX-1 system adenine-specific DNA-methyltransferase PglX [Bacteroides reticulotermitis]